MGRKPEDIRLRKGWTTGACAAAAARAAYSALISGSFPAMAGVVLPKGETPEFHIEDSQRGADWTSVTVRKDAGDDPDITHGAFITAKVQQNQRGMGLTFLAGTGVGTVTKPGLPLPPGEPAINPKPREMIEHNLRLVAPNQNGPLDVSVEISVLGGEALAEKTWNPRLGIMGGISILGTTGIVIPYSCSAWIHSIHRGIDVARANGFPHVAAATGKTSDEAIRTLYDLPVEAMIDMGDFAGGMLKYLRRHPLPKVSIAGGFAKLAKLSQGHLDLHSSRSTLDLARLAADAERLGGPPSLSDAVLKANTGAEALSLCLEARVPIAADVAQRARNVALATAGSGTIEVVVVGRSGDVLARTDERVTSLG